MRAPGASGGRTACNAGSTPATGAMTTDTNDTDHIAALAALLVQVEILLAEQRKQLTAVLDALIGDNSE